MNSKNSNTDELTARLERLDAILVQHAETLDPKVVEQALKARTHLMAHKLHQTMHTLNANKDFDRHTTLVDVWLLSQILYYQHSMPVLDDHVYDQLSRYLRGRYDLIADDPIYSQLIQTNHLDSGSGEDLIDQMPRMIKLIARWFPR